jgi:hypothetical protein
MAKRYYKDTPHNRKLGRVGKEITKATAAKKQPPKKSDDDPIYDKEGRKDRSRVKSSKYVDSDDDDSNPMPTTKKKALKQPPKKKKKAESKNTPQYQRLLDRTKARKAKKTVAPPKSAKRPAPPSYDEITKDEKKKPAIKKGETDKEYNDRYFKQLQKKRELTKEINEKGKKKEAPDAFEGLKEGDFDDIMTARPSLPTKPKPKKAPQKAVKVPPKKREVKKPIRKVIGITPPPKPPRGVPRKKTITSQPKESLDQMIDRKYDEHKTATKNRKFLEGILESSDEESNAPISLVGKKDIPTRFVSYKELLGGMDKKYQDSGRLFPSNYLGAYIPETEFNLTTVGNNLDDRLIAVQEAVADMDRQGEVSTLLPTKRGRHIKRKGAPNLKLTRNTLPRGFAHGAPANSDIKRANDAAHRYPSTIEVDARYNPPKPHHTVPNLVSIGGGIKKEVRIAGRPAPVDGSGFVPSSFKSTDLGVQDLDLKQELEDKARLYHGAGAGGAITSLTEKEIEKEIEKRDFPESKRSFTAEQMRARVQDTQLRAPGRGAGFIKNTRADYAKASGKKPLYKDRKEALIQGLLAGGNERTLPVRNPRYFKGNKRGDAEFIREGEVVDQVSGGIKTRTKDRGDGIVPKKDAKIPPKPKQPKTNKAFLAGRKLKDLSADDKKAYEKIKKANQRYTKKLLEWTTKYGNIPAPRLKVPPSSALLTQGTPRVIDTIEEKGTPVFYGGDGITSITKKSTYQKGVVKDAMRKAGISSKQYKPPTFAEKVKMPKKGARTADAATKEKIKASKARRIAGFDRRTDRLTNIQQLVKDDELLTNAQLKERRGARSLNLLKKQTTTKVQDRLLKAAGRIGKRADDDIGLDPITNLAEDKVQVANMIQEALEAKGKYDAKYQKIRQSDAEFQRREGQQRAVEVMARKGNKRAIGVKSNQDVASRLAKIEKDNYKPSNVGSGKGASGVDTRYFNLAQDWQSGETFNQEINRNDGLGDISYGMGWSG